MMAGLSTDFLIVNRILSKLVEYTDQSEFFATSLATQSAGQVILQTFTRSSFGALSHLVNNPIFASLGQTSVQDFNSAALYSTIIENLVAVIVGHFIFICLGAIILRLPKFGNSRGGHVLSQTGEVLSITILIAIKVIMFPIFCGILIDIACFPLFPNSTTASR